MKKTIKMIGMVCLMGAFAFLGSSCKKEKTETATIRVSMPAVEEMDVDGGRAYIDYGDHKKFKWSDGDIIMVYNLNNDDYTKSIRHEYVLYNGADEEYADFTGHTMGAMQSSFYAFYPSSKVIDHEIGPRNSQTFDVPASQDYNVDCMDPTSLVMAAKGETIPQGNYNLKHIFGFANIKLKGNQAVDKIVIKDNVFNLNGNVTVDLPKVDEANLQALTIACGAEDQAQFEDMIDAVLHGENGMNYNSEPGDNTMTLNCGGVQLSESSYTNFIITLRPGALRKGFKVYVYYEGQQEPDEFLNFNAPDKSYCVKPAYLKNYKLN